MTVPKIDAAGSTSSCMIGSWPLGATFQELGTAATHTCLTRASAGAAAKTGEGPGRSQGPRYTTRLH